MYKVLKSFHDLKDNGYFYSKDGTYPRQGYKPTAERITELSGKNNLQGVPLIKKIEKEKKADK